MDIKMVDDYNQMSALAAGMLADFVKRHPCASLCLPTGGSVVGTYEKLCAIAWAERIRFAGVSCYNMDEYASLSRDDPNGYYHFLSEHLYSKLDIAAENTFAPEADLPDLSEACARYTRRIQRLGRFDLTLLGIGEDGHIAFNMPSGQLKLDTHLENLSPETIEANARFFSSEAQVPRQAVTIGVGTIMNSRKILLVASGRAKAKAIGRWLNGRVVDPGLPASVLWLHPDVTVILDRAAAADLPS